MKYIPSSACGCGEMLADTDWIVRLEAVLRAPLEAIVRMVDDVEPDVCAAARQRLSQFLLGDEK